MDAFDADVLIYAIVPGHELGRRVRALFPVEEIEGADLFAGIGSVLLVPELLTKPRRERSEHELVGLGALLSRIDLRPTDLATAELATDLGARYRLRAADSVHLASAVGAGADRFLTNNTSDFPRSIAEIDITYPATSLTPWVPEGAACVGGTWSPRASVTGSEMTTSCWWRCGCLNSTRRYQ